MAQGKGKRAVAGAAPPRKVENRAIIVLKGLDFQDSPLPYVQARLKKDNSLSMDMADDDNAVFYSAPQSVRFVLRVLRDKATFKAHLESPEHHVIYGGHARYGRGACFGPNSSPGDVWDVGTSNTPNSHDGLYRLGFHYVPIPLEDILHHGYTYTPVAASVPMSHGAQLKDERHPDIQGQLGNLSTTTIKRLSRHSDIMHALARGPLLDDYKARGIDPKTVPADQMRADLDAQADKIRAALVAQLDSKFTPDTEIWFFNGGNFAEGGARLAQLPLEAGWKDTINAPFELDKTKVACRTFCHFGCDSFHHFSDIVTRLKGFKQTGNEGYSFYSTSVVPCSGRVATAVFWIYHLLTYDKYNAYQSWGPSLKYTMDHANRDIRNDPPPWGTVYRIQPGTP
jgi:hypothetical protein